MKLITLPAALLLLLTRGAAAAPLAFSTSSVDASGNTGHWASLAIGSDGILHAGYFNRASGDILYRTRTPPAGWAASETAANGRNPPHLSLALGGDGAVHMVFFSTTAPCAGVCHAKRTGGAWAVSAVEAVLSSFTAVAVDPAGVVHAVYATVPTGLRHARFDGTTWGFATIDASAKLEPDVMAGRPFRTVALALDAAGKPRVAYFDDAASELRYAAHDGTSWGTPEFVGQPGAALSAVSLALDGSGVPRIAAMVFAPGRLLYASKAAGAWTLAEAIPNGSVPSPTLAAALALDGSANAHAAFHDDFDPGGNPAAAYADFDGVAWSTQTVDTAGGGSPFTSLALDAAGNPHILYADPDAAAPELKYASATGAGFPAPLGGGSGSRVQAPTGFTPTGVFFTSVTWVWTDNSSNESGFKLFGATSAAGPFAQAASVAAGLTTVTETGLLHGATYFRYVAALNTGGVAFSSGQARGLAVIPAAAASGTSGQTLTYAAAAGEASLSIPPGAFPGAVVVSFSVPTVFPDVSGGFAALDGIGIGLEITAAGGLQPSRELTISLPYSDASVGGRDESKFILARFDATARRFVPLVSTADPGNNRVTGKTSRLSLFQIMSAIPAGLAAVKPFPNPLRPAAGHASMIFTNLPAGAVVRILTLDGRKVRDLAGNAAGQAAWDGRDLSGDKAASGIYLALVESADGRRTIKIAVQR